MKLFSEEDTIVALSSPLGSGAIAVIRVSGSTCLTLVNPLLKKQISPDDAARAMFNIIHSLSSGETIDQVVSTYFKGPVSYTGEDVLEISCHCNPLIIDRIIQEIVAQGARIANPGEFTFRAFMNQKLNLSQAEAVAQIINSRSRQSLTQSMRHLEGKLADKVEKIREEILKLLSLLEISLDFSEEDIEVLPLSDLKERIHFILKKIDRLMETYDYGRLLQDGIKLLILGKPNVGKSSLLNVLLEKERAIVSEIPGTTRDYIEASLELDGLAVQAFDTAGIRQTEDAIEAIGVERALEHLQSADIALCLFEAHQIGDEDDALLQKLIKIHHQDVQFIAVLNKSDLGVRKGLEAALQALQCPVVKISVKTLAGMNELKKTIRQQVSGDQGMESEEVVITSARHKNALEKTRLALSQALKTVELRASEEILAVDIRLALDALGEITGETTPAEILNHIFANFCIGK